jgi:hypothetical protein
METGDHTSRPPRHARTRIETGPFALWGRTHTRRTHRRHLLVLRARARAPQIGVFTCAIQSQAKRPRIRFKFRMFNTTKRAARRLLSAVPSGNGPTGRQAPGARTESRHGSALVDLSPPGPVDARATRDVYGSAKRRPAVRRWESPERDRRAFEFSDSLSNYVADVRARMRDGGPRRSYCADSESRPSRGTGRIKLRSNCEIQIVTSIDE